ncbi:MAG: cytochrome c3 family protein [Actinomycetota bacterium]|nr:cytochrome c3 family protein [Actinomycetota bacterium]
MQRFDFLEFLLAILSILVIVAILATVLALAYPDVTASIVADIRQSAQDGRSPVLVALSKIGERLSGGFNYRIKPFIRKADKWFAKLRRPSTPRARVVQTFKPKDCDSGCHAKLFDQPATAHVYVEHRLHEALEVPCSSCHTYVKHPKPRRVAQKVCIDCHKKTKASIACDTCHPPGSILAAGVIPEAKTKEFMAGRTATLKALIGPEFAAPNREWLADTGHENDANRGPCRNCHEVPDFCNTCHLVFHDKEPNWRNVHGPRILKKEYLPNGCWTCHNPSWCANTCHSGVGRQRRKAFLPAPIVPLEDYVQ